MISRISHIQYPTFISTCEELFRVCFDSEYQFLTTRKFAFDFALPCCKLAIEVEGIFGKRNHRGITNRLNDIEKQNLAMVHDWRVLIFTAQDMKNMAYIETLRTYFSYNRCSHFLQ